MGIFIKTPKSPLHNEHTYLDVGEPITVLPENNFDKVKAILKFYKDGINSDINLYFKSYSSSQHHSVLWFLVEIGCISGEYKVLPPGDRILSINNNPNKDKELANLFLKLFKDNIPYEILFKKAAFSLSPFYISHIDYVTQYDWWMLMEFFQFVRIKKNKSRVTNEHQCCWTDSGARVSSILYSQYKPHSLMNEKSDLVSITTSDNTTTKDYILENKIGSWLFWGSLPISVLSFCLRIVAITFWINGMYVVKIQDWLCIDTLNTYTNGLPIPTNCDSKSIYIKQAVEKYILP